MSPIPPGKVWSIWHTGTALLVALGIYLVSCPLVLALCASRYCKDAGLTERAAACVVNHACANNREPRGTPVWVQQIYAPVTRTIGQAPKRIRHWYADTVVWCVRLTY